jgi:hypothetical protein
MFENLQELINSFYKINIMIQVIDEKKIKDENNILF